VRALQNPEESQGIADVSSSQRRANNEELSIALWHSTDVPLDNVMSAWAVAQGLMVMLDGGNEVHVCTVGTGIIGAYIIPPPRVPDHAHSTLSSEPRIQASATFLALHCLALGLVSCAQPARVGSKALSGNKGSTTNGSE
jgi:hypothetical protein